MLKVVKYPSPPVAFTTIAVAAAAAIAPSADSMSLRN
jgi:hypothetical protein